MIQNNGGCILWYLCNSESKYKPMNYYIMSGKSGLTQKQVAEKYNCSVSTVESRI